MTPTPSWTRRQGLRAIVALLVAMAIALFTLFASRRVMSPAWASVEVEPSHPRVAPVFSALESGGLAAALDSLEHRASSDSLVLRSAHQLAHALGRQALLRSGGEVGTLKNCRPAFASGCYHGVVEALLSLRGRIDMPELQRMCLAAGSEETPGPVYECVHGLGHGVLGAVAMDVDTALRHCDSLDVASFVASCHQGVFMESIATAFKGPSHSGHPHDSGPDHHTIRAAPDPGDPYSPCDRYADPYADSCWLFQGFVILRRVNFDPGQALGMCDRAPAGRAERCYESVGHQLAGLFQRGDVWIIEQCEKGKVELSPRCAAGAALALASMDWSGLRVTDFCSVVPNSWVAACTRAAKETLEQLASTVQREILCGSSRPEAAAICRALGGARGAA